MPNPSDAPGDGTTSPERPVKDESSSNSPELADGIASRTTEPPSAVLQAGPADRGLSDASTVGLSAQPGEEVRFLPGTRLAGRFRIVSVIGRGGMGEVYRADDLKLGQPVALKFLPESVQSDRRRRELFLDEVKMARRISHPNVCRVHDVGEVEGLTYFSMEYIDGEDLGSLLRRIGRLAQERAIEIAQQIARGLAAAHKQGVLHRDLKPANLMIDGRGRAKITDFGLAGLSDREAGGTPAYMAPELFQGAEPSVQSDLYALGLVLYELFTGRKAFQGKDYAELARQHRNAEPLAPSYAVEDLEEAVEEVILECLAKDPADRPGSATEVAVAFYGYDVAPSWHPSPGDALPQRPHWVMGEKLGEGGFGEVWLATHKKTGDRRVFKLCHEGRSLRALKREVTLFRLLRKELGERDDIARILDWNLSEPPFFIELEHANGGNLVEWTVRRGAELPLAARLEIVAQVATALAAAHSVGILHKDVKPTNVLIDERRGEARAQLTDFGIGTVIERRRLAEAGITAVGMTVAEDSSTSSAAGTRLYMAPEQVEGRVATLEADVYALGVILYQVVVGDFSRSLAPGWRRDIADEILREDIAAAVDRSPEQRPSAAQLASALRGLEERRAARRAEDEERKAARRAREALARNRRRWRLLAAASVVLALFAGVTGLQNVRVEREARRARDVARVAVASSWLDEDPTRAALVLREIERPNETPYALSNIRRVLGRQIAEHELRGHRKWIAAVAWSPDATRLASASSDGTARIWNADGRGKSLVLEGHSSAVNQLAWSHAGRELATASEDGTVRIWKADASTLSVILGGHTGGVVAVGWSGDDQKLASASKDGTVRIWHRNGREAAVLTAHGRPVETVVWSPAGEDILSAGMDGTVRLWRIAEEETVEALTVLSGKEGPALASWSGDGRRIAAGFADGRVCLAPALPEASPTWLQPAAFPVSQIAWSPSGRVVAAGFADGTIRLWNTEVPERPPLVLEEHDSQIESMAWSEDGRRLATGSFGGDARVWSLGWRGEEPVALRSVPLRGHRGPVFTVAWSGDRLATGSGDRRIRVWDLSALGDVQVVERSPAWILSASWSNDDRRLATASFDGRVRVWSLVGEEPPLVLEGHRGTVYTASWSPIGQRLATASWDGTVRIWDLEGSAGVPSGNVLSGHRGPVIVAAWSPDARQLASVSLDQTLRLWDVESGEELSVRPHGAPVFWVSWHPDGTRLATGCADGRLRVWDARDADAPASIAFASESSVMTVAWSHDGRRLAVAQVDDGTVRIQNDDGSGEPVLLRGHEAAVVHLAWSGDDRRLVTASWDGTVRVWQLDGDVKDPLVLEGHSGKVNAAQWSHDGHRLATSGQDGTVRIWRVDLPRNALEVLRESTSACLDPEMRTRSFGESPAEAAERYAACERLHGRDPEIW